MTGEVFMQLPIFRSKRAKTLLWIFILILMLAGIYAYTIEARAVQAKYPPIPW